MRRTKLGDAAPTWGELEHAKLVETTSTLVKNALITLGNAVAM